MKEKQLLNKIKKEAASAAEISRKYFGKVIPTLKLDRSYLTDADLEIESLFKERLPRIIKGSVFVGEETTLSESDANVVNAAEWAWVVDPIDGTASFVDKLPNYCISIALMRNGKPYAGVILFPETGDVYEAVRGYGCFYNGRSSKVKRRTPGINDTMYSYSKWHQKYRITYPGKIRNLGTTAGHMAMVARGAGTASLGNGSIWDYAAAATILMEAGGTLKYIDGTKINWPKEVTRPGRMKLPILGAPSGKWKQAADYIQNID